MNLGSVMSAVAARIDTISGLRVYAWPAGKVSVPAAVVGYPTSYTYDMTYGRGYDTLSLPVVVVVGGAATSRQARDVLAAYVNPTGSSSVKYVLETGTYTAFTTIAVKSVEFDTYTVGAVDHIAAIFDLEISGSGTT